METSEWTRQESEQIGRWLSGIVVGEFEHNGELTVGWARAAHRINQFAKALARAFSDAGNSLTSGLVARAHSTERKGSA